MSDAAALPRRDLFDEAARRRAGQYYNLPVGINILPSWVDVLAAERRRMEDQ